MNNNIYQPQQPYGAVPQQPYDGGAQYNNYNAGYNAVPQSYSYNAGGPGLAPPQPQYEPYNKPYDAGIAAGYQESDDPAKAYGGGGYGVAGGVPPSGGFASPFPPSPEQGEKFPQDNSWRDVGFFVGWVVHLFGVFVLFGFGILTRVTGLGEEDSSDGKVLPDVIDNPVLGWILLVVGACTVVGLCLGWTWLILVQKFAKHLIKIGMVFSVLILFGFGALSFAVGSIITGIILCVFGVLMVVFFYLWRKRIKFATKMLKLAGRLVERFPATVRVAYVAMLVQFIWVAFWSVALALSHQYATAISYICAIYLIFSLYWTSQVIKNVVHVTTAGTMATWYFMDGSVGMPPNPTLKSLKRASTTSLGSICFGSLIIAILRTLRFLADMARSNNGGDQNIVIVILACLASCILSIIESLVEYFNQYAFAQVAIYGKTYIQAAKDTWALVHSHGIAAIINDNLVGSVMGMVCFVSAACTGTVGALLGWALEDKLGGDYWILLFFVGFFVGFIVVMTITEVVESAVITIFVCFAEDPEALRNNDPRTFKTLTKAYEHGSHVV